MEFYNFQNCSPPKFPCNKELLDENLKTRNLEYLIQNGSCLSLDPSIVENFDIVLQNITHDTTKLNEILSSDETLNVSIHQNIACLVSAILKGKPFLPTKNQKIHNWFKNPKIIGEPTSGGYAFTTDDNLFVFKANKKILRDDLVYEALVGIYVTNLVRQYVPNFMYVYGYTKCSRLIVGEDDKIKSWCNSGTGDSYLITENIKDSVSMEAWFENLNITQTEFISVLYQIINALNIANILYGYTHNDLHLGNILIRGFDVCTDKYLAIPSYQINGDKMEINGHILTQYVPYIIDYGFNSFLIGGEVIKESKTIYGEISHGLTDLLEFLSNVRMILIKPSDLGRKKKLKVLDDMIKLAQNRKNKTIQDFLNYSQEIFNPYILSKTGIKEHKEEGIKISFPMKTRKINSCDFYTRISTPGEVENTLEYLNLLQALHQSKSISDKKRKELIRAVFGINLKPLISIEIKELKSIEKDCEKIISKENGPKQDINTFMTSNPSYQKITRKLNILVEFKDLIANAYSLIDFCLLSIKIQISKKKSLEKYYEKDISDIMIFVKIFDDFNKIYLDRKFELGKYGSNFLEEDKKYLSNTNLFNMIV